MGPCSESEICVGRTCVGRCLAVSKWIDFMKLPAHPPIGHAIENTTIYTLDDQFTLSPDNIDGELFIGGRGVARGYWKHPALTAERFLPHPSPQHPGERLFRTGDRARRRHDGQ